MIAGAIFLLVCMLLNTMSSCSMMAQSIGSVVSGTTYPSDDPELVAVEADYAAKETALQAEIDNIESSHPGYDEYRYDLDMIGHDPMSWQPTCPPCCKAIPGRAPRPSWSACSTHSMN